ncbi:ubiquitin-like modifier-activating enzyme ATG7 [Bicyclus anynana]|uniref:Ubiquitin-like modifier-activating enzyme ATG7 n=1 Tax=Bicyclus anynana TaxID=110368 RepID=A0A6J1NR01_BICAN|nr:ubiquitin-like modifier-activating enzyme ATG7 [Bicyclus anynana]
MSKNEEKARVLQFAPFKSFIHPSFWHNFTEIKWKIDKLSENTKEIYGRFSCGSDVGPFFEVDGTAFNKEPGTELQYFIAKGTLMNKNTIDDFQKIEKSALLCQVGEALWAKNISTKLWVSEPSCLLSFIILSFANLKTFHYHYWIAFPTTCQPTSTLKEESRCVTEEFNENQIKTLLHSYQQLQQSQKTFFLVLKQSDDSINVETLDKVFDKTGDMSKVDISKAYFAFTDSSKNEHPSWSLRMFLAALLDYNPKFCGAEIKVLGVRYQKATGISRSRIFNVLLPDITSYKKSISQLGWVGWEKDDKGHFAPRVSDMSASMSPSRLAAESADLNIKLMQWRLLPELNIDVMQQTKCLLIGAGTLGCHVARNLLAWGFRHITFVDEAKVSYSNPTRQVLYNHSDSCNKLYKVDAAVANLKSIHPGVETKGLKIHIPMPGHPVGEILKDETISNIHTLIEAIRDCDVIFLLLDSREARWLPTLIAADLGKIVINAALGFDSYLVMRHGIATLDSKDTAEGTSVHSAYVPGDRLGCYFCNDVTAPGNSQKDRTLDQQCTVTRPGASAIAGALAVELLVSILQHQLGVRAPAPYNITDGGTDSHVDSILGPVPHSIRGFLHSYQTVQPTYRKFNQCTACSDVVIDKYRVEGIQFLLDVFDSPRHLESVTGLSELQVTAQMSEVLTLSDDDQDSVE